MIPFREIAHGETSYPVYAGSGLLEEIPAIAAAVSQARSIFVASSPAVHRVVADRLGAAGTLILVSDSEQDKTLATAERVITELIQYGAKRDSLLIAVGGGVIGDTAGFAASIYLRGIDLIHVPTTLLAQVDSSIGGKVAVNHAAGKNLIGSFYPPRAVVADIDVLASLPAVELRSGMFEALKAGVIADPDLFDLAGPIHTEGKTFASLRMVLTGIVQRAIGVKADIVESDPRDSGLRRLLNYGHTIGHAIESSLHYQGITHGDAVAWGMIGANAIAVRRGLLEEAQAARIGEKILSLRPERPRGIDRAALIVAMDRDKKFTAARRVMVLPRRIGECVIVEDVTGEEIRFAVDAALG